MKPKTVDRWDLDVSFAGTTVHAVYQNFHALSKLEAEVRGMAYARINNPRSTVLKVKEKVGTLNLLLLIIRVLKFGWKVLSLISVR